MNKLIEYQYKKLIKRAFKQIFTERNIVDTNKRKPIISVSSIQPLKVIINLRDVCSFEEFEKNINYIKTYFKANEVFYELVNGLVTKIDIKEKRESKEKYLVINFLDVETGDMFSVIHREIEILEKIQPMSKYVVDLNLSSSKYGLKLELEDIKECKGEL